MYFLFNKETVSEVKEAYKIRTSFLQTNDSLKDSDLESITLLGNSIIESVYDKGFIEATSQGVINDVNSIVALKKDNQVQDIIYNNLLYSKEVFDLIKSRLGVQPYNYAQNINLTILSEVIKPNVSYDRVFTQKVIDEAVNDISPTKGKVSNGELIILLLDRSRIYHFSLISLVNVVAILTEVSKRNLR